MAVSRDLPDGLRRALADAGAAPTLLVASDFDGTIAPIVAHPPDARPIPAAADALAALAALRCTTVALISGRAVRDLRILSGAPDLVQLIGSHGSEFSEGFLNPIDDAARALLEDLIATMTAIAARYPGASVETKPVSVAFHVRNVAPDQAGHALDEALAAVGDSGVHVTEGKAVREFAVIDTDKGAAIDLLRDRSGADATVYFGDDVTDEKAFARLTGADVGVKVGSGQTRAGYRVDAPDDVAVALRVLLDVRSSAAR